MSAQDFCDITVIVKDLHVDAKLKDNNIKILKCFGLTNVAQTRDVGKINMDIISNVNIAIKNPKLLTIETWENNPPSLSLKTLETWANDPPSMSLVVTETWSGYSVNPNLAITCDPISLNAFAGTTIIEQFSDVGGWVTMFGYTPAINGDILDRNFYPGRLHRCTAPATITDGQGCSWTRTTGSPQTFTPLYGSKKTVIFIYTKDNPLCGT